MGKAPTGHVLYVREDIAKRDGINVDRLVAYHRSRGLKLVTTPATDNGDGTATCHGCNQSWPRTARYWQVCDADGRLYYQEVCRECEGLVLRNTDRASLYRLAKMDERVAKGVGTKSKNTRPSTGGRPVYGDRFITLEESKRRAAARVAAQAARKAKGGSK